MIQMILDKNGVSYDKKYVEEEAQFFRDNGITEAPTLLVMSSHGAEKIVNPSNIKKYFEEIR